MNVKPSPASLRGEQKVRESLMKSVFFAAACISILCVALICLFLFANGVPAVLKIGPLKFFAGSVWKPGSGLYGIAPMILGSLAVTLGAIITGAPLGILCAVFMARFCPARLRLVMSPAITLLAGIPSVVYGFFGLMVLSPALRFLGAGNGKSILTASLLLGIMILPVIVSVSEAALRAVPDTYYEGALALGASSEEAVFFAQLPAAAPGVTAGVILGVGRSIGETMAVIMVAGNQAVIPESIFKGVRTLTANIVLEMGYAADLHREALIATAATLFVFIMLINLLFALAKRRMSL
ncbi:MAG: phosphate ABC transporter permease subunit PstC [Spirochaetaceae bacterium]|jgi:phosphate transport system permease protein|nr:phosphate ABC transporter permease subunit PstC [Spirochaetaceae bacterium]